MKPGGVSGTRWVDGVAVPLYVAMAPLGFALSKLPSALESARVARAGERRVRRARGGERRDGGRVRGEVHGHREPGVDSGVRRRLGDRRRRRRRRRREARENRTERARTADALCQGDICFCARLQARDTSERVSRANVRRCVPEIRRNALYTTVLSERARCSLAQNENYSYTYSRLFVHTMAVFFSSWTRRRRPAVAAAGGRHVAVASSRASKTRGRLRRAHDTQRDRRYHSLLHSVLLHVHDVRARAASARHQIRRFLLLIIGRRALAPSRLPKRC